MNASRASPFDIAMIQPPLTTLPTHPQGPGVLQDDRFIPVSLRGVDVSRPLPVDLLNAKGMLLLPRGQALDSLERQVLLSRHQPVIREQDRDLWMTVLRPRYQPAPMIPGSAVRPQPHSASASAEAEDSDLTSDWLDLHARWGVLLHQRAEARDFLARFDNLREQAWQLVTLHPDESLFVLDRKSVV